MKLNLDDEYKASEFYADVSIVMLVLGIFAWILFV